jgi:hypothetical protein
MSYKLDLKKLIGFIKTFFQKNIAFKLNLPTISKKARTKIKKLQAVKDIIVEFARKTHKNIDILFYLEVVWMIKKYVCFQI